MLFLTLDQIQLDALSAATWSCCLALHLTLFVCPSQVRYEIVVQLMKPRKPTLVGITGQVHHLSSHTMHRFSQQSFFLSKASSMFSSQGTVSSTMIDCVGSYHNVWSFLGMHDVMWEVKSFFRVSCHLPVPFSSEELLPLRFADLLRWGLSLEETETWVRVLGGLLASHP